MPDNLAIINRVIQEHQRLRGNIKLVGDSVSDLEAIFSLQQASSGWSVSSAEALTQQQQQLQKTMGFLFDGLNNHFAFEERELPPLLGELLTRALLAEHAGIRGQIGQAKSLLIGTSLAELTQEKLLAQKSRIQMTINTLGQTVEEHAAREETILNMMKRTMEEKHEG